MALVSLHSLWQGHSSAGGRRGRQEYLCPQSRRHVEPGPAHAVYGRNGAGPYEHHLPVQRGRRR